MSTISEIVARTGIVDPEILKELSRWKLPAVQQEVPIDKTLDREGALNAINEMLESKEMVEVRSTDLDVLKQYLQTLQRGKLHLFNKGEKAAFQIDFGRALTGEYIIPWKSDNIEEILVNGESFLLDHGQKIFFISVEELFFDDVKAFMLCTPKQYENDASSDEN